MGILGFLFGLGCLVVIVGAITILGGLVLGRKRRQPDQRYEQQLPKPTELGERLTIVAYSYCTTLSAVLSHRVVALRQPLVLQSNYSFW